MQGNARGTYESGGKVPGECRGRQGNARECRGMQGNARGTYGSGCIAPGECRELPGKCKVAGVKC